MAKKKVIRTQADFNDFSDSALWREELNNYLSSEDWHEVGATGEPGFENSWTNYTSVDATTAAFYKNKGLCYLKGMVGSGSSASDTIFTLPEGYRPPNAVRVATYSATGSCYVRISADGTVSIPTGGSTTWSLLDGALFRI